MVAMSTTWTVLFCRRLPLRMNQVFPAAFSRLLRRLAQLPLADSTWSQTTLRGLAYCVVTVSRSRRLEAPGLRTTVTCGVTVTSTLALCATPGIRNRNAAFVASGGPVIATFPPDVVCAVPATCHNGRPAIRSMSVTVTPLISVPALVSSPFISGWEPAGMTGLPADADSAAGPAALADDGDALGEADA